MDADVGTQGLENEPALNGSTLPDDKSAGSAIGELIPS